MLSADRRIKAFKKKESVFSEGNSNNDTIHTAAPHLYRADRSSVDEVTPAAVPTTIC